MSSAVLGPDERLGVVVPIGDPVADLAFQGWHGTVVATPVAGRGSGKHQLPS